MSKMTKAVIITSCLIALTGVSYAASGWLKGNTEEKIETLVSIQPGLGTVMVEYANRYTNIYYAAKGGNWGLAAYQLKEVLEIQEVAEVTRPSEECPLRRLNLPISIGSAKLFWRKILKRSRKHLMLEYWDAMAVMPARDFRTSSTNSRPRHQPLFR
ncbi:hypothetical protein [Oceanisphaera arctica]|uniref:Uncharacterized protein n=1 Tax=Oceanisphaera arctica TaxID=641510 RepID=A0A2P5TQX2_9GAMM|nr:hypothetical protein [Oceanisphaera arctica]PPL18216.1 hypothetical protein UN63_01505 [Oceanisphaera arctica]GHA12710.1 hypothetical protein GCM10007082_12160 [Oceanisphaera arctica]